MDEKQSRSASARVEIRTARPGDAGLVLAFIRELAEYEKLRPDCVAREEDVAARLFGEAPRVFCEIATVNGEDAGFALWFYSFSTFRARHGLYLEDLYVRPPFRGCGAGKALLRRLAQRAVREGCARFEWTVLNWNQPSILFYEGLGARPLAGWTAYRLDGAALESLAAS